MNKKVSIIILNWNGWNDTIECLESLYQIDYPNYEVIVVDNGSEDESIEKIKQYCKGKIEVKSNFFQYDPRNKPIKILEYIRSEAEAGGGREDEIVNFPSNRKLILIKNEKNFGFAEGNNIAIRYGLTRGIGAVLLLNNDMVVDREFLSKLVRQIDDGFHGGIATPKVYFYAEQDRIQFCAARINFWTGGLIVDNGSKSDSAQCDLAREVNCGHGGCALINREVFETVGLLDEGFFIYWEDMDYWFRARYNGYKIIYSPAAVVWHKGGSTSLKTDFFYYYLRKGRCRFMAKHATSVQLFSFFLWFSFIEPCFITVGELIHHRGMNLLNFYKGTVEGVLIILKSRI